MKQNCNIRILTSIVLTLFLIVTVYAQDPNFNSTTVAPVKTRTELLNELSLREAQVELDNAREAYERYQREYENAQNLFNQSIISKRELDQAFTDYRKAQQCLKEAEIKLEKTKLGFLDNATHITIVDAKKYYNPDGQRMLDLVLKNTSSLTQAESAIDPNGFTTKQVQALLDIENIIVSVMSGSASIGKPHEQVIPLLPYDKSIKLAFVLLTDANEVGVSLQYLDQNITKKVFLEKESLQKIPSMVASQFSQEGELNSDIYYDLDLEMLVTSDSSFSLSVTNLPQQIKYSFIDKNSNARITQVRFTEEVSRHSLKLNISIPKNLDLQMVDKSINFQTWVLDRTQLEKINKLKREFGDVIDFEKLKDIEAGRVDLSLIPKGLGKLEIVINNLLEEIKPGQDLSLNIELSNIGTLPLFNVVPEVFPPAGWKVEFSYKTVDKLLPEDKKSITIILKPGPDVTVGEYEAQIKAKGQSGSTIVEALEKRLHIRVTSKTNITTTLILVFALVILISGVVYAGVKMSRR